MPRVAALLASFAVLLTLVPAAALAAPSETSTWIVTLRERVDASSAAPALARQHGGRVGFVYEHALNGFSFRGSQAAATALLRNPGVLAVEADAEVWLTQSPATWGLDRIDQRELPLNNSYIYAADGTGVTAYVIDSGINTSHEEFGGRALAYAEADFIRDGQNGEDCNGHGTHVAGTIGGSTYGVAKAVTLVSVRVFGCSGGSSWEVIIAGIDWVIQHHPAGVPAVANMSLGGGSNSSVDTATNNLIKDGVATAVAAGNGNWLGRQANACNYSPARVPAAMTVSATDSTDTKASWANYGDCVDWFAPGVSIVSASHSSSSGTSTKSGTSMASPHTAGVAALYLDSAATATPAEVRDAIYAATTRGAVKRSSTTNNHLLYSLPTDGGGGGDTTAPAVSITNPTGGNVSGTVTIQVSATDAVDAADTLDVEVKIGDGTYQTASYNPTSQRYELVWDTTSATNASHTIDALARDAAGNVDYANQVTVTVSNSTGGDGISLLVTPYKVKGVKHADLTWSGVTSAQVDVYRDHSKITTIANENAYTDTGAGKGGGSHIYTVCEAGTTTCSNDATASY